MSAVFLSENLFDLSICFYTDDETELERRLARDTAVRGRDMNGLRLCTPSVGSNMTTTIKYIRIKRTFLSARLDRVLE